MRARGEPDCTKMMAVNSLARVVSVQSISSTIAVSWPQVNSPHDEFLPLLHFDPAAATQTPSPLSLPLEDAGPLEEVDSARAIDVLFTEHVGRALAQLGHHCAQLHGVYHAVAVLVEAREDALHLVVRQQADCRPRRKRHAGQQRAAVPLQGCLNPAAKDPTLTFVL